MLSKISFQGLFGYCLFAENSKLMAENAVTKYFLKCKTPFTCYCSRVFVFWLVHEQCHGTNQKTQTPALT